MKRTAAIVLLLSIGWFTSLPTGYVAAANAPEEIWKSLEKLQPDEREKKLMESAKAEGEMLWYTNSGMENAGRYIQAFKKKYPFIKCQLLALKDAPGNPKGHCRSPGRPSRGGCHQTVDRSNARAA